MNTRTETDFLGSFDVPENALYGIHTARALSHFPSTGCRWAISFYRALSTVKLACLLTNRELGYLGGPEADALEEALREMSEGHHSEWFVVDPHAGGAGTSVNMNINEIAANVACLKLQEPPGSGRVDPLTHVNLHQSTNDVFPTAVHVGLLKNLDSLEEEMNHLLLVLQELEHRFAHVVKLGRTQLTPAVPTTLGRSFSTFAEMISRDRWRVFKAKERIRTVNLGGTAIGTGIAAPRPFILQATTRLRRLTGLPLARAENLVDATANHDTLAEAFSMVKVVAVNLEKLARDLRLMHLLGEISLPPVQVGSSIMPGKVNPVICESAETCAIRVQGDEAIVTRLLAHGELELNAFLPLAAWLMFHDLELLQATCRILRIHALAGVSANAARTRAELLAHPASATLLIGSFGHATAETVARHMGQTGLNLMESCRELGIVEGQAMESLLSPERILALGFTTPAPPEETE